MADVSKFSMFGQNINIKDASARESISNLNGVVQNNKQNINRLTILTKDVLSFDYTVYIGDSYLDGYLLTNPSQQNWGAQFSNIVKPSKTYYMSNGGGGFCNPGNGSGKNAVQYLEQKAPEIGNKETVTAVICCLGFNDLGYTGEEISPQADFFWQRCNSIFPNAKKIFFVNPSFGSLDSNKISVMSYAAAMNGAIVIESWWWLLFNSGKFKSDYIHPNEIGHQMIAEFLYTSIHGGKPQTSSYYQLPAENGFINNIIAKNDSILLFIEGNYTWNEPHKKVADWGDKIFITQGAGWKGAPNNYRDMVPFGEGDNPWIFGYVQWYRNDNNIYVSSMANINSPSTYSTGTVSFYRPLHQAMLFG